MTGDIQANVQAVRARIARAAGGRNIRLVAVSKFQPAEAVAQAAEAGITDFGENRAQEFRDKSPLFPGSLWHFIGQLQTNKVKYVVGKACLIQSVDRLALAQAIDAYAARLNVVQEILLEINLDGNPDRGGVSPQEAPRLLEQAQGYTHIHVAGLMTVPPLEGDPNPWFEKMAALFAALKGDCPGMEWLSMGMSGDYEAAIGHGANMVRVGRGIFNERKAP